MKRAWVAVGLCFCFLVVSCSGDAADGSAEAASSDKGERRFLSLGTAPPGGAFFVVGGAISEVLNEYSGDNGWESTAEATKGSQENIRRLASGELDLALANSAISYFAIRGEGGWDKAYPIRTVMTLAPNVAMFISSANGDVKTIEDLRGKRVTTGPAGAGFEYFIRPLLAAHGLTYDDFTSLPATQVGAVDMLSDGSAAAVFLGGAVPTASITQASASRDVDEELVYRLTKTIYENRAKVVEKHPAGRAINPKNVIRNTGTEFHPGAIRFYEEIGIWPQNDG